VDSLLAEVNRAMSRLRWLTKVIVIGLVLMVGVLPFLTEKLSNESKVACLIVAGLIGSTFAYLQLSDKSVGIQPRIMLWGRKRLERLAMLRGVRPKLDRTQIEQTGTELKRSVQLTGLTSRHWLVLLCSRFRDVRHGPKTEYEKSVVDNLNAIRKSTDDR